MSSIKARFRVERFESNEEAALVVLRPVPMQGIEDGDTFYPGNSETFALSPRGEICMHPLRLDVAQGLTLGAEFDVELTPVPPAAE